MKRISILIIILSLASFMLFSIPSAAQYNPEVYEAQKALKELGYNPGKVDGREVGRTPLSDVEISPGEHRIRVEKEGYETYQRQIRIERDRAMSLYVDLSRKRPRKGRLFVETEPVDARVRILNIGPRFYQGIELEPGRYHVEVSSIGYKTKELWVTLGDEEDKNIRIRLEPVVITKPERKKLEVTKLPPTPTLKEIARGGHFIAYDNGTVKDTKTGLMWAGKDNGEDITWQDAKKYCENYRGGGYSDWRMPTKDELDGTYDKNKENRYGIHITNKLIDISACCSWALETRGSLAVRFNLYYGLWNWACQSGSLHTRALPVRSGN